MPFYSKDWRSPGEAWVKTRAGWEKKKVLECTASTPTNRHEHIRDRSISNVTDSGDETADEVWVDEINDGSVDGSSMDGACSNIPPHCRITLKCTREIAGFNGLSEAVRRLDFTSAVKDVRRFNYICALLGLLMSEQKLTALPGNAQKILLTTIEDIAMQVYASQQNPNALRGLLATLYTLCEQERRSCWGRPLGSRALWGHHHNTIRRINNIANQICIDEPGPDVVPKLQQLPEECIREILLRISDHRDLEASAEAWAVMASVCSEQRIWRELVIFHFTPSQIDCAFAKLNIQSEDKKDWKAVYHSLRKSFGIREDIQYAETLSLCRHCKCLFWRSLGHPCIADECPEYRERVKEAGGPLAPHPIPPAAFLKFFSL